MSIDSELERWLRRTRTLSRITWHLAASVLTLGVISAAFGLIDWSPAFVAVFPERAQDLVREFRGAPPAASP